MTTRPLVIHFLLVLTLCAVPAAAHGADAADQKFDASLMGEWLVESSNMAGKESKPKPPELRVRVTKNRVQLIAGAKTELDLDCRLDASKTPRQIDLTVELDKGTGPFKMTVKGIWQATDSGITLCFNGDPKGARPQEFKKPTKENQLMLFKLKNKPSNAGPAAK